MLYTRKGDNGTTKIFGCDQHRISKSSSLIEALGSIDEINSFLGLCKVKSKQEDLKLDSGISFETIIEDLQNMLFIIQAQIANFPKSIEEKKIKEIEDITDDIEKNLPTIKTFFISGGHEVAALLDIARTLSRRAERRVIAAVEDGLQIDNNTKAFLNRLSSILYALARFANHKKNITELAPRY